MVGSQTMLISGGDARSRVRDRSGGTSPLIDRSRQSLDLTDHGAVTDPSAGGVATDRDTGMSAPIAS